jgi:glycine/D-amino acid oxidase-like deaminating enzyme
MGKISTAEVLRLRAISRALWNSSARRFAQDDGFARRLKTEKHLVKCAETRKLEKVTGSQDDGFARRLKTEKHLVRWVENAKTEKVTGSQNDDFVGGLVKAFERHIFGPAPRLARAGWRGHPSRVGHSWCTDQAAVQTAA